MMPDYPLGQTLDFKFTTRAFATGIPTVLAGTPVIEVYEDNSLVQIVVGETLIVDFDAVVGLNNLRIVATGANGYESGKSYSAIISAGTVGGVSVVGEVVAQFSIERSPALRPTVAGRTLDVEGTGEAGINLDNALGTLDAAQFGANSLDGKGDWNIGKAGYSLAATGLDAIVSTAIGMVEIAKAIWDRVLSGATHNIATSAGRRLRQLQEAGGYIGAIWIDTVDGVAGTTDFENGTDTKPSLTIADANTLAASVNIERFEVAPGSSITFAAAQDNQSFSGDGWILALGGQSIAGSTFRGADISGIGIGQPHEFHDCHLGVCTFGGGEFKNCGLEDTFTISGAVRYSFIDCYHAESGAASSIDFGAAGATEVHIHNWHGNLTILNMGAGDILHFSSSNGSLTMDASCTGGTRNSAGTFGLTDNSTGMTVNDIGQMYQRIGAPVGADISADIAAIPTTAMRGTDGVDTAAMRGTDSAALASVATEARLAELDAANLPTDVDAILDDTATTIPGLLPSALVGGRMDSDLRAINGSTVAAIQLALSAAEIESGAFEGTPTITVLQTDLAETQDDIYIGRIIIISSGAARGEATEITDYAGGTGTLTVVALANAPAATDTFILI